MFFTYLVEQQPDQVAACCESLFTGLALYFLLIFSLVASLCTPTDDTIYVYPGRSALAPPATFIVNERVAATVQRFQHEPCRTPHPQPTTTAHTAAHYCNGRATYASQCSRMADIRSRRLVHHRAHLPCPTASKLRLASSDRQRFDGASARPHSPRRPACIANAGCDDEASAHHGATSPGKIYSCNMMFGLSSLAAHAGTQGPDAVERVVNFQ